MIKPTAIFYAFVLSLAMWAAIIVCVMWAAGERGPNRVCTKAHRQLVWMPQRRMVTLCDRWEDM